MQHHSSHSIQTIPGKEAQAPSYLTGRARQENILWQWWYRLASPPEPKGESAFQEIERFRRGRTGSQIILALYFLLIIAIPARFVGTNIYLLPIIAGSAVALSIATVFNRLGKINMAGAIVVLTFTAFPILNIVTTPGGLSMLVLPIFGLLVLSLLCAVSFLPPGWIFVMALANILFTLFSLVYLPRTAELSAILAIAFGGIVTPIILSQVLISFVAYAWVRSTTQALLRADRAEELAKLEHDLALQSEAVAQQKHRLEASIQKIVETHMRVANGDFDARVPLLEENVLWQISGPLNTLLARTQRWRQDAAELYQVKLLLQKTREENEILKRHLGRFTA
jgi:hypothetical protein